MSYITFDLNLFQEEKIIPIVAKLFEINSSNYTVKHWRVGEKKKEREKQKNKIPKILKD